MHSQTFCIPVPLLFILPGSLYSCSPLRVAVCESCLDFYRNWSGRFLGEISARKWKAICIEFVFLWLGVFPQGTDEPVSLFRRSLELSEYVTMSHVKCWKMSEDNGSSAEDTLIQICRLVFCTAMRLQSSVWKQIRHLDSQLSPPPSAYLSNKHIYNLIQLKCLHTAYTKRKSSRCKGSAVRRQYLTDRSPLPTQPFCVYSAYSSLRLFTWVATKIDSFPFSVLHQGVIYVVKFKFGFTLCKV